MAQRLERNVAIEPQRRLEAAKVGVDGDAWLEKRGIAVNGRTPRFGYTGGVAFVNSARSQLIVGFASLERLTSDQALCANLYLRRDRTSSQTIAIATVRWASGGKGVQGDPVASWAASLHRALWREPGGLGRACKHNAQMGSIWDSGAMRPKLATPNSPARTCEMGARCLTRVISEHGL